MSGCQLCFLFCHCRSDLRRGPLIAAATVAVAAQAQRMQFAYLFVSVLLSFSPTLCSITISESPVLNLSSCIPGPSTRASPVCSPRVCPSIPRQLLPLRTPLPPLRYEISGCLPCFVCRLSSFFAGFGFKMFRSLSCDANSSSRSSGSYNNKSRKNFGGTRSRENFVKGGFVQNLVYRLSKIRWRLLPQPLQHVPLPSLRCC